MRCPRCRGLTTGRVGFDQYFCWECCIEWSEGEDGPRLYSVSEEGELQSLEGDEDTDGG